MNYDSTIPNGYEPVKFFTSEMNAGREAPKYQRFKRTGTNEIMAAVFPPIMWIIDGYLTEGFSVLAGRQKLGKTWLAIDWALAVAAGGYAMGSIKCDPGNVLYVDMENGHRRIQRRIDVIFPSPDNRPDLSRLDWVTDAPGLNGGFIACLEDWRRSVPDPRLVVIDVLQRIKPAGSTARNAYENDYACFADLQSWATSNSVAIVALHHTRKGGADDPLEALTGSNGLSAVADNTLVLDRDANGMTLYVRGRDIEEKETALKFDGGLWTIQGEASEVRRTDERSSILSVLIDASEPMSPKDISVAVGASRNSIDQLLYKMGKVGEVIKQGRGNYIHPERRDLAKDDPTPPNKISKKVRNRNKADGQDDYEAWGGDDE
jgi:hypothetical protein